MTSTNAHGSNLREKYTVIYPGLGRLEVHTLLLHVLIYDVTMVGLWLERWFPGGDLVVEEEEGKQILPEDDHLDLFLILLLSPSNLAYDLRAE